VRVEESPLELDQKQKKRKRVGSGGDKKQASNVKSGKRVTVVENNTENSNGSQENEEVRGGRGRKPVNYQEPGSDFDDDQ